MLVVAIMSVFGGSTNLSTHMSAIVRAGLRGMSGSRRGLLVRSAKRHHYRVQILERDACH